MSNSVKRHLRALGKIAVLNVEIAALSVYHKIHNGVVPFRSAEHFPRRYWEDLLGSKAYWRVLDETFDALRTLGAKADQFNGFPEEVSLTMRRKGCPSPLVDMYVKGLQGRIAKLKQEGTWTIM